MEGILRSNCVQPTANNSTKKFSFKVNGATRFSIEKNLKAMGGVMACQAVRFGQGILAGTRNFFLFRIMKNLTVVEVEFPSKRLNAVGIRVTGMRVSLLAPRLAKDWDYKLKACRTSIKHMTHCSMDMEYIDSQNCYRLSNLTHRLWPEDIDEFLIDITVEKVPVGEEPEAEMAMRTISLDFISTELTDMSIECDREIFRAHTFVMTHDSEKFQQKFGQGFGATKKTRVKITETEPEVVREMLRYFYTGCVKNMNNVGSELFKLAVKYDVERLRNICLDFLMEHVNLNNARETFYFSLRYDLKELKAKAEKILVGVEGADYKAGVPESEQAHIRFDMSQ